MASAALVFNRPDKTGGTGGNHQFWRRHASDAGVKL